MSAKIVCSHALAASAIALGLTAPAFAQTTTTTYTYDALGRLTSAVNAPSGRQVIYAYDAAGNRVQVGNGVAYQELLPTAFTSSGALTGSGLSPVAGMKDGVFGVQASYFATLNQVAPWVQADLGSVQNVDHVDLAPASNNAAGLGVWNLAGSVVEYQSGSSWVTIASVSGPVSGAYVHVPLGGVAARYFRVRRTTGGVLALGDFRFYSSNDSTNVAPIATPDVASTNPATAVTIPVLANDTDADGGLMTVSAFTQPANGTVTQSGSNLIYTPPAGYSGIATFTYTVLDNKGSSAQSTVAVTVLASANRPPIAATSYMPAGTFTDDGTGTVTVVASDPDNDPWAIVALGYPSAGRANIISANRASYTRSPGYTGGDRFTYTVSDGKGGLATSSIIVNPTTTSNTLTAQNDSTTVQTGHSITFDPRVNDTAPAGDVFVVFSLNASAGTASISSDGTSIIYTPPSVYAGSQAMDYQIVDQYGNIAQASVFITVTQ